MEKITLISVNVAYGLAFVLFILAVFWQRMRATHRIEGLPPDLPFGKVPVWFYTQRDLIGLAAIVGVFYLLGAGNAATEGKGVPILSVGGIIFSIGFQFFMAALALVMVIHRVSPVRWLGLAWRKWPLVFVIAPLTVVSMWFFFGGLEASGYMDLIQKLGVGKMQDTVVIFQKEKDPLLLGLMAFAAAIVAPICEEIVFRGYLYPVAKRFAGPRMSALCIAMVFSATHGSMAALLPLFVFGLVLVAIYEKTGSIWAPMSVHFLFNSATVTIQILARTGHLPQNMGQ